MYKEVLRTIAGIEVYPVLSLLIFVTVFVVMLVWVLRLDRRQLNTYAALPLEESDSPSLPSSDDIRGRHRS